MSSRRLSLVESIASLLGGKKNAKDKEPSAEEVLLETKTKKEKVKKGEKQRKAEFQRKQKAAATIQRAWRRHKRTRHLKSAGSQGHQRHQQILRDSVGSAVKLHRVQLSQADWEKQIAALTIQLAWRKFYRRKLLKSLHPNRRQLRMWDPDIVALKQQALIAEVYSEQLMVPFWHPTLKPPVRPFWFHLIPSPAAVSFNFALDQYHPYKAWQGMRPHSWTGPIDDSPSQDYEPPVPSSFRPERSKNSQFSYNLRKA